MTPGDQAMTPKKTPSSPNRSSGRGGGLVISVAGKEVSPSTSDGRFELPKVSGQVDIVFVFDRTGSMSDKIDGLTTCLVELVKDLATLDLDWRISCLPFGDLTVPGDRIEDDWPFVTTESAAISQLQQMPRFSGGGNQGESSAEAMVAALAKPFRKNVLKLLIVLTDEPSLDPQLTESIASRLRKAEALCFVASLDMPYFRRWANENGGRWYPISSSMDTSALRQIFREMLQRASKSAREVLALGWSRYRELGSGQGSDR
jgi:hypothetical protein